MGSQTSSAKTTAAADGASAGIGKLMRDVQRLLESPMQDESTKLDALRTAIKVGLDDFDDGNFTLLNSTKQIESFVRHAGERAALRIEKRA